MNEHMNGHINQQERELPHIHRILFSLLVDFDKLCREHGLQYFLGGGTLLGAVRHQGFIPWDDDIDVMMLRDDYDRLCALPASAIPSHLFLQTYKTDHNYHGDMAKLRLNHTIYATEFSSCFQEMHNGFFIDIFVHDKTAKSVKGQKLHIFMTRLARSLVFHKWEQTPLQFYGKHKMCCHVMSWIKNLLPMRVWENAREWILTFYRRSNSPYLYDGIGQHLSNGIFPAVWLSEKTDVLFEGKYFPAPTEYHCYLQFSYGDYMTVPKDAEKRFHKIQEIDFGPYQ